VFHAAPTFSASAPIVGAAVALGGLLVVAWRRIASLNEPAPGRLFLTICGLFLWIGPAALLAASERYQTEIYQLGASHLNSTLETIGFVMLAACGCDILMSTYRRAAVALGMVSAVLPFFTLMNTAAVIAHENKRFGTVERERFITALRRGAFDRVPNGATVV